MAAILNDLDAFLQADTPRTVSVNLGSNVNVNGTLGGTPVNTVVTNAANAAAHASSSGNPHNVNLTQISGDLDDIADGVTFFRTNANQVTGAGRGFNALNSSSEYIKSLKSTQLTVVGSNPANGWVGDANGIRMYQSSVLMVNIPVSGNPSFGGDIVGGGDISITGYGSFTGSATLGGRQASLHANLNGTADNGVSAFSGNGSTDSGLKGSSSTGYGVFGEGTGVNATGVRATHVAGGVALYVGGRMTMTNTTMVTNLNADMVDGKHASALCNIVPCNTGTCTVSGNGFNLNVTGSLAATVRTRGTSNFAYIENISDARLKTEIEHEFLGLDFINSLTARTFRMIENPELLAHGLIYQEVVKLLRNRKDSLASLNNDGTGGVDYNGMVSPIIKAIQELSAEVNLLKSGKRKGRVIDVQKA
ncbi:MAG: tail fiber domain-containing protein [Nitrosomonas sp.]|uniref:tail fiber domain-containing protein n=1 Tax=Nitrosomonas sp. TaxID=42353 RepID=UPI0025CC0B9B|nr:tail fiber domain-containing protein [Nitrosomonas sp.]MBY0473724.1 tail fiber domain-containing protein [Nitrosomonas sp.]